MKLIEAASRSEATAYARSQGWAMSAWSYHDSDRMLKGAWYDEIHVLPSFAERRDRHKRASERDQYVEKFDSTVVKIETDDWVYTFSRQQYPEPKPSTDDDLRDRIAVLEAKVAALDEENAELRKTIADDRGFSADPADDDDEYSDEPFVFPDAPAETEEDTWDESASGSETESADDAGKTTSTSVSSTEETAAAPPAAESAPASSPGSSLPRYDRAGLEEMNKSSLKFVARTFGIKLTSQRPETIVKLILDAQEMNRG